jgi:iron complex outermembrane receptor protein
VSFGVVGDNLLNDDIRNSVSFKKDEVLLPGRGVKAYASVRF